MYIISRINKQGIEEEFKFKSFKGFCYKYKDLKVNENVKVFKISTSGSYTFKDKDMNQLEKEAEKIKEVKQLITKLEYKKVSFESNNDLLSLTFKDLEKEEKFLSEILYPNGIF